MDLLDGYHDMDMDYLSLGAFRNHIYEQHLMRRQGNKYKLLTLNCHNYYNIKLAHYLV